MLILDFETRSRCDLKSEGAYNYALDGSTDIICCAFYDLNTDHKQIWYPHQPLPKIIRYELETADYVVAHNAEFDRNIYNNIAVPDYGFPEVPFEKWYCSSAQARVNALPASLDDAAWALGLKNRKLDSGVHLIKKLSIPQKDGTFNMDADLIAQMGEYCMQDVVVTAGIVRTTRPMTQSEHQDWLNTVAMNEKGVKIDRELAMLALSYAEREREDINKQITAITGGEITSYTQTARIRKWVSERVPELARMMTVYKDGKPKLSLDKNIRSNILNSLEFDHLYVPPDVSLIVQLLDDGNKSSVAKFSKMITLADPEDDRVRGAFMYGGATQTLRFTSRGLQLHNMRRDAFKQSEAEEIKKFMADKEDISSATVPTMDVLAKMLRPAIIPEKGNVLIVGDWSSIEARVLPWLSDTDAGDKKLRLFTSGADVYVDTAIAMGLTEEDRQIGKTAELACGYQGGKKAFQNMANIFRLNITEAEAERYVKLWRTANPWAVQFWAELQNAVINAIRSPNTTQSAGMVDYIYSRNLMDGTLLCIMPNDTIIQYPKVRVVDGQYGIEVTALKASFKPKADEKEWPRVTLYGGLLAENCTQAFSAAILRNALKDLKHVIAHVHDEIILEVPETVSQLHLEHLEKVMSHTPDWASGLPLTAKPSILTRYGK